VLSLHSFGIIHRYLKPNKVLLNTKPKVDLKINGFHRSSSHHSKDRYVHTKNAYYLPRDVAWEGGDKRWDIYALSLIIYEWYLRRTNKLKGDVTR
jgi:serine/threonine protein kinase